MTLLFAHALCLLFTVGWGSFRLYRNPIDRVLTVVLLSWANIVVTALILSILHSLGNPLLFVRTSILLAVVSLLLIFRIDGKKSALSHPPITTQDNIDALPILAFFLTIAPLIVANLLIAVSYPPNNYDSMAYHLPRVMFYLGQGSLEHFDTVDARKVFFPFNSSLLHLAILQHGIAFDRLLTILHVGFWLVAGAALYRICRLAAYGLSASLAVTWLALTSTEILAQATSTTDNLLVGATLLAAVVFIQKWRQEGRYFDSIMAGVALGLAFGTKLTPVFFIPTAVALAAFLAYRARATMTRSNAIKYVRIWAGGFCIFVVLSTPFAIYNIFSTGYWMTNEFDFTLNQPFSFDVFWQTTKAYTFQFFFEPFQRFTFDLTITDALNRLAEKFIFPNWNSAYAFSPFYLFPPDLNEDHVWFGFAGPFAIISALACVVRDRRRLTMISGMAVLGLGWLLFYFALNKWSLYIQRYFVEAFLLMVPCCAYYFDKTGGSTKHHSVSRIAMVTLFMTAYWFSMSYLFQNTSRPLLPLISKNFPKPTALHVPDDLSEALLNEPRVNIIQEGGNERIYPIMRASKTTKSFTSSSKISPTDFNIVSKITFDKMSSNNRRSHAYVLVPIFGKRSAGVRALGEIPLSSTAAFAYYGVPPISSNAAASNSYSNVMFILKTRTRVAAGQKDTNDTYGAILGLNEIDEIEAEISAEYPNGSVEPLAHVRDSTDFLLPVKSPPNRILVKFNDVKSGLLVATGEVTTSSSSTPGNEPKASKDIIFNFDFIGSDGTTNEDDNRQTGLAPHEGPYQEYSLPLFRWAKQQSVRLESPANEELKVLRLTFSARLQVRDNAELELLHNKKRVKLYHLTGRTEWIDEKIDLPAAPGTNEIELRDTLANARPDWDSYIKDNPDVLSWIEAQGVTQEEGAIQHYTQIGRKEGRSLSFKHINELRNVAPESLFVMYRTLQLTGRKAMQ